MVDNIYFECYVYFCQVSEDKEAKQIVGGAIATLITEIEREISDIKELRYINFLKIYSVT